MSDLKAIAEAGRYLFEGRHRSQQDWMRWVGWLQANGETLLDAVSALADNSDVFEAVAASLGRPPRTIPQLVEAFKKPWICPTCKDPECG